MRFPKNQKAIGTQRISQQLTFYKAHVRNMDTGAKTNSLKITRGKTWWVFSISHHQVYAT